MPRLKDSRSLTFTFKASGVILPDPPFLDKVVIHFAIYEDKDHYHVPLFCSPWSHSTYRGS
jgi:5-hydroxyisourate hydrolase